MPGPFWGKSATFRCRTPVFCSLGNPIDTKSLTRIIRISSGSLIWCLEHLGRHIAPVENLFGMESFAVTSFARCGIVIKWHAPQSYSIPAGDEILPKHRTMPSWRPCSSNQGNRSVIDLILNPARIIEFQNWRHLRNPWFSSRFQSSLYMTWWFLLWNLLILLLIGIEAWRVWPERGRRFYTQSLKSENQGATQNRREKIYQYGREATEQM